MGITSWLSGLSPKRKRAIRCVAQVASSMVPGASEPVRALLDASFDQLQELEHAEEIERLTQLIDQRFGTVIQAVERRENTPEAVERTLTHYLQQHAARHQSDLSAVTQEVRGMSAVLMQMHERLQGLDQKVDDIQLGIDDPQN